MSTETKIGLGAVVLDERPRPYRYDKFAQLAGKADDDPDGVAFELAHRKSSYAKKLRAELEGRGHWHPDAGRNLGRAGRSAGRRNGSRESAPDERGHVYLEGDARPYRRTRYGLRGGHEHTRRALRGRALLWVL